MCIAGLAVAHQRPGVFGEHAACVDRGRGAVTYVHQGEIFGAGDVHAGQAAVGAARSLDSM